MVIHCLFHGMIWVERDFEKCSGGIEVVVKLYFCIRQKQINSMVRLSREDFHFHASPRIIGCAKALRKRQTEAERILWKYLRRKNMKGYYFRRQHALKYYVVDFLCFKAKLVIEVDGLIHLRPGGGSGAPQAPLGVRRVRFTFLYW